MTLQTAAVFTLLLCTTHALYLQGTDTEDSSGNSIENDEFSVSTLLEKVNASVGNSIEDDEFSVSTLLEKVNASVGNSIEDDEFSVSTLLEKVNASVGNSIEDDEFSVSTLLEKVNASVGKNARDPLLISGDIEVPWGVQNAAPCTSRGCLWTKANNGKVYVPYQISDQFSQMEKKQIMGTMGSFSKSTCIRFKPRKGEKDFIDIQSLSGCSSTIGRKDGGQEMSLNRTYCLKTPMIQHEMLHMLGFKHEQSRSDRDQHVRILLENVIPGKEKSFAKAETNNLGTPYDNNSVMQYPRDAFSKNNQPTIIPIPDPKVPIGEATKMSANDILRVNRLYNCSNAGVRP